MFYTLNISNIDFVIVIGLSLHISTHCSCFQAISLKIFIYPELELALLQVVMSNSHFFIA